MWPFLGRGDYIRFSVILQLYFSKVSTTACIVTNRSLSESAGCIFSCLAFNEKCAFFLFSAVKYCTVNITEQMMTKN